MWFLMCERGMWFPRLRLSKMATLSGSIALLKASSFPISESRIITSKGYQACGSLLMHTRCFHGTAVSSRKKSEWRMFRRPCNTELRPNEEEWIKERKAFGGRNKVKAIWKNKGSYMFKSKGVELEVPIVDVVLSNSNKNHIIKKIMTQGSIVQIDGTAFNNCTADESKHQENELESTSSNDQLLSKMIEDGKLYAKITTRPGQDGLCNGYVLEGVELQELMEQFAVKESHLS